jgi:hypothetical protein
VGEGAAASRWLRRGIPAAKSHGGSVPRSGAEGPTEFEEEIDELAVYRASRFEWVLIRGSGESWPWSGANRTDHDVREDSAGDLSCGVGCVCDCPRRQNIASQPSVVDYGLLD